MVEADSFKKISG